MDNEIKVAALALSPYIDHTLLRPDATCADIESLCCEAIKWKFAAVAINPIYVPLAAELLARTGVKVVVAIGFPFGATTTATKVAEANEAVSNRAEELDMVINIGALKSGDSTKVKTDIIEVVSAAAGRALVKVILETCYLSDDEKVAVCKIAGEARADFVKTSTGFGTAGATVEDVRLMRKTVGVNMGVKAAGGIRDTKTAKSMLDAGANRLGTSNSVAIVRGEKTQAHQRALE